MARTNNLKNFLTDVAGAIKEKKGSQESINAANFDTEIASIETGVDTSDATATTNDILNPKTAYVDGQKLVGQIATIYDTTGIDGSPQNGSFVSTYKEVADYKNYETYNLAVLSVNASSAGAQNFYIAKYDVNHSIIGSPVTVTRNNIGTNLYFYAADVRLANVLNTDGTINFFVIDSNDGGNFNVGIGKIDPVTMTLSPSKVANSTIRTGQNASNGLGCISPHPTNPNIFAALTAERTTNGISYTCYIGKIANGTIVPLLQSTNILYSNITTANATCDYPNINWSKDGSYISFSCKPVSGADTSLNMRGTRVYYSGKNDYSDAVLVLQYDKGAELVSNVENADEKYSDTVFISYNNTIYCVFKGYVYRMNDGVATLIRYSDLDVTNITTMMSSLNNYIFTFNSVGTVTTYSFDNTGFHQYKTADYLYTAWTRRRFIEKTKR